MLEMFDLIFCIIILCCECGIIVVLMIDVCFFGGLVGLVIGYVGLEVVFGGLIVFVEDGDFIVVDFNINMFNCLVFEDVVMFSICKVVWDKVVVDNGGIYFNCGIVDICFLYWVCYMVVLVVCGGGLYFNCEVWVCDKREVEYFGFELCNWYWDV